MSRTFVRRAIAANASPFPKASTTLRGRAATFATSASTSNNTPFTHLVFGANTDVGKTVVTAGLVRAAGGHYLKPMQCGGSDEHFVERHAPKVLSMTTLFDWDTATSPHVASRLEDKPVSDNELLSALNQYMDSFQPPVEGGNEHVWIETAGGVLSPSSSSPENGETDYHATNYNGWGWVPQGDLYKRWVDDRPKNTAAAVLIGDGRLGGISATLSSLESLLIRGYNVAGMILIETDYSNQTALREYASSRQRNLPMYASSSMFRNPEASIVSLPALPPEPEPLMAWYESPGVTEVLDSFVEEYMSRTLEG